MIETEDRKELQEIFDVRYVKKDDCVDLRSATDKRIDTMQTDVALVKQKLSMMIGILSAIGVPVLAIAIKLLFGGA